MAEKLPVADVLERAADLIEPEGRWTQGALYRDRDGNPAGAMISNPICWCAVGAVIHVGGGLCELELAEADLAETSPGALRPLSSWNDAPERTQAEVVAKLRQAAALAREQGQ